ncbi:MAG: DUF1499 domain-containing protein [Pseudomonadota bacterium]
MVRVAIIAVAAVSIIVGAVIFFSGPGTRLGLWEYGTGLGLIRTLGLPALVLAAVSLGSAGYSLIKKRALLPLALVGLAVAGGAATIPLSMRSLAQSNPYIHDITTDFDNPPQIIAGADAPRNNPAEYVGAQPAAGLDGVSTADAQRQAFADIKPLIVDASIEDVVGTARTAISDMGMAVLADYETEGGWAIEATHTSLWYGFIDDFVVRIGSEETGGTRIDVRSKSRVGTSDLGANAARIRDFMERVGTASA